VVGDGNTVITSAHVLPEGIDSDFKSSVLVQVRDAAGTLQPRDTQVLAIDKAHDLAVLRIGGSQVPVMQIGNSDHVREGQPVAFMGFPMGGALGYSLVSHRGWVSAITPVVLPVPAAGQLSERSVRVMRNGAFSVFQLDGTAYPGNSGGPLVDPESGEVLGVINMVFVKGAKETALSNPSGISYAVPANWAQSLLRPAR
jgi:S1-C subfamily serine protease